MIDFQNSVSKPFVKISGSETNYSRLYFTRSAKAVFVASNDGSISSMHTVAQLIELYTSCR